MHHYFVDPSHMDLIFDYATWVIKANPEDGLKVILITKAKHPRIT